ncbi:hypothetical protein LINPERPRIM_LOCUS32032 [Linum perenne]
MLTTRSPCFLALSTSSSPALTT